MYEYYTIPPADAGRRGVILGAGTRALSLSLMKAECASITIYEDDL